MNMIVTPLEITFGRMIVLMGLPPFVFSFIFSLLLGFALIPIIRRLSPGQQVRDDGPSTHLTKSGTPTFGGLIFIIPVLVFGIFAPIAKVPAFLQSSDASGAGSIRDLSFPFLSVEGGSLSPLTAMVLLMLFSGLVGFIDDYIKVRINKNGLSASAKSILLLIGIIFFTAYYLYFSGMKPYFLIPFTDLSLGGVPIEPEGFGKLIYGAVIVAVLYFTGNSVNITDGVDGLASSVTTISAVFIGMIGSSLNSQMSRVSSFFVFAIAGGCAAFFMFNKHPARIFMGDTGSQALGAAIGASAVLMGTFWILIPVGIIYVAESLSVVIQVAHYKRTKERVFRMAPLHHHFELGGWSEWKVTAIFSIIGIIGGVLGLLMVL
ncbi:MAG: phospho-N-acetylmuramoyl-pentapeptide-transferase [Eubacteriales bacterium]|nr:phospho-N-acetylmuramoyl-pentapeptide-transferase [Eubacteriales bacterium]MDD4326609.1 phospho-N-acetylmuramoyl-pentapeptide-transferase [Eubacteriales bacterium]MDD4716539.1 phospho-N-acetylmuramoyl-pentapeptide-transferase [Eubacteriales bacterium]